MAVDQKIIVRVLLRDRGKLLAYIGAIVRDAHIAEDVLQEVSMLALEKQEQILNEAAVLPWMRTAARFRSQERNREDARARLVALLQKAATPPRPRKATKPSRSAREQRMKDKAQRGSLKRTRRAPSRDD